MRLLVTGGAGFIGSNFVHYWLERHPDDHLVVLDLLTYAGDRRSLAGVEDRIVFVEGDIGDLEGCERLLKAEGIEVVVNFAAESHNSLAVVDPSLFFRTNALGTQTLLEAARRAQSLERFHHVSTCEVYGDLALDSDEVFTEDSPYRPRTPYNASKAAADHAVRAYHEGELDAVADVEVHQRSGTFREHAWKVLRTIPAGHPVSYAEYAELSGNPAAVRAAASACARNAAALFVPCHRVVRTGGAIGNFRWGIEAKRWLLSHESTQAA